MNKYKIEVDLGNLFLIIGFLFIMGFVVWAFIHNEIRTLFGIPLYSYGIIFMGIACFKIKKIKG